MTATRIHHWLATTLLALAAEGTAAAAEPAPEVLAPVPAQLRPSALAPGWQHGAFAEIYVRAYRDSNGDGIGDLRGLTSKLDYLRALGVRGIWLMPITRSTDHDHGYAVEDYRSIEPAYGTLADFDELVAQAHARGIGIVLDYVINHSGSSHPLFVAGAADRDSPYRRWYLWRERAPRGWSIFGRDPWVATGKGSYFAQFSPSMPDFDLRAPGVMAWHADNLRFWLNRGVDGFRFDAVAHLVENGKDATRDQPEAYALMREAVAVVHGYPNRYVVCEATRNEATWAGAEGCGGAFALALAPTYAAAAKGDAAALRKLADYFRNAPPTMATMASNHDLFAGERLWDQVGGDLASYRLAAAAYLLAPGTPFVYYGEEIGMPGAPALEGDARVRTPMSWKTEARGDSLLAWYRQLIALRNDVPAIARGSYLQPVVEGGLLRCRRELDGEVAIVLINTAATAADTRIEGLAAKARFRPALPTPGAEPVRSDQAGVLRLRVPARSVAVFVSAR